MTNFIVIIDIVNKISTITFFLHMTPQSIYGLGSSFVDTTVKGISARRSAL